MVRKLALAVSLALGTLSVPVHALGLGELSSKSALNQNFNGDITLLSVRPEELDGVRVRLADPEAFARAGVERPFYLSLLRFEPTLTQKGNSVIRVTSEFPIREPFMNFLIEVNWPSGRLVREYTVLLDPPTTTRRRPPRVTPAAKSTRAAPAPATTAKTTAPVVTSTASVDGSEYGPVVANDTAWSIAKKVRPGGVSMEQMMMALLEANPHAFVDGNINRLRTGRILRVPSLAEIRQISRQQARQAYREQQDEWLASRNEKLQKAAESESAGETEAGGAAGAGDPNDQLRIATARPEGEGEAGAGDDDAVSPTASDLKSRLIVARENAETSRQEAETLRTQVDDLQARLENMQKLLSLKDDQLAQFQDRLVTEEAGPVETVTEPAPEAAPEVAVEEAGPVAETAAPDAAAEVEEAVVAAVEEAVDAVAADAEYRIEDIAPQVDPDLIVLGGGVEDSGVQDVAPPVDPDLSAEGVAEEAVIEAAADEVVVDQEGGDAEIVIEAEPATEPVTAIAPTDPVAADIEPTTEPAASEPVVAEQETMAEPVTAAVTEPAAADPAPGNPIMRMVEQNMLPVAAGGVSLLALFGWLVARGRRKGEESGSPLAAAGTAAGTVAAAETAISEPEAPVVDEPALDPDALSDLPDSSFLDEFSPSDINSLQDETGEVDPVSEADVYIAYGRYQQAEEMLQQAMSRDPDRLALKHKLLEVFYATRNAGAFTALAQEMVDAGQDTVDETAWSRAQDMGRELAPENTLFALDEARAGLDEEVAGADETAQALAATAAAAPIDDDTLALDDLELSELTSEFTDDTSAADDLEAPSEVSITLDLDEPSGLTDAVEEPELPEPIRLDDLEALDVELPKAELESASAESEDTISDSIDIDSMMAEAEAAVDMNDSTLSLDSEFSADELQAQLDELSDLSVLDSEPEPKVVEPPAGLGLVEEDSGTASESLDEPLNLDAAFDAASGEDGGADVLELGDVAASPPAEPVDEDEVATKLDLARAYVEMGDEDGARAILEEVVVEGTQSQRGDAQTLLSNLA